MTNFDPEKLLRQDLLDFVPYTASSVTLGDFERFIKFNANENPYGASPKVLAALADMRHWEYYPLQDELLPAIGRYVGVDASTIAVGNGADEVIDLVLRIFIERSDTIVDCPPSFSMYSRFALFNGARVIEAPRREDFSLDLEAIERAVAREHPKIVFVASPSNPDGTVASRSDIERLLALPALIVLDEAYAEFSGESYAARVPTQANLFIVRTFSKWAGLAGLRIGYCIAPPRIADQIMRTKSPYNVNIAAIIAALVSLDDAEYLLANVRRIVDERARLSAALSRIEFLRPLPSRANFILCRMIGRNAKELRDRLAQRGILIRVYSSPRLRDYVRISVGTPEQDEMLVSALKKIADE